MVKVEIVDEKETLPQRGASPYSSAASSRTGSSVSVDSLDSEPQDESLFDRLAALRDIVPPATRHSIASGVSNTASFFKRIGKFTGNAAWVVSTSLLLVGLPLALSLESENAIIEQEKAMLAQGGQSMLPSSGSLYPPPPPGGAPPTGQGQNALTPPGF